MFAMFLWLSSMLKTNTNFYSAVGFHISMNTWHDLKVEPSSPIISRDRITII